jgi:hypothetical protein
MTAARFVVRVQQLQSPSSGISKCMYAMHHSSHPCSFPSVSRSAYCGGQTNPCGLSLLDPHIPLPSSSIIRPFPLRTLALPAARVTSQIYEWQPPFLPNFLRSKRHAQQYDVHIFTSMRLISVRSFLTSAPHKGHSFLPRALDLCATGGRTARCWGPDISGQAGRQRNDRASCFVVL